MKDDSTRDTARREALELVGKLLTQALFTRQYGRLEVVLQDGAPSIVREERIHKIGPPPPDRAAA